jgi:hypothetical protein
MKKVKKKWEEQNKYKNVSYSVDQKKIKTILIRNRLGADTQQHYAIQFFLYRG